jgi:hypothetical protein
VAETVTVEWEAGSEELEEKVDFGRMVLLVRATCERWA